MDHETGTIFLLSTRSWAHNNLSSFQSREDSFQDMWLLNSTDLGLSCEYSNLCTCMQLPRAFAAALTFADFATGSTPQNITPQVWNAKQHTPALNNGHGVQTSTGRLIVPACARPDAEIPAQHMKEQSAIIYSDDHGHR